MMMKRLMAVLLVWMQVALPGVGWGATRYVSPTGLTPAGFDYYYTTVNGALNAINADGDEVILEMSTAHTLPYNAAPLYSFSMRNANDSEDAENCIVTVGATGRLNRPTAGNAKDWEIKGVKFKDGTFNGVSTYYALLQSYGQTGDLTATGCIFENLSGTSGVGAGGFAYLRGAVGNTATVTFTRCKITGCKGGPAGSTIREYGYIQNLNTVWNDTDILSNGGSESDVRGGSINHLATLQNVAVTVNDLRVSNNYNVTELGWGDGVFKVENLAASGFKTTLTVNGILLNSNTAGQGPLYIGKNSDAYIWYGKFIDNTAIKNGGAFRRGGEDDDSVDAVAKLYYCYFDGNHAGTEGGAIAVNEINRSKWIELYNTTLTDNTAANGNGHTIWVSDANDLISQKSIAENVIIAGEISSGHHIYSAGNDGFDHISAIVEGGEAAISDTGATLSIISADPLLDSSGRPAANSPAINAGTLITGIHDQATPATDIAGTHVLTIPDIGAYEYPGGLYFNTSSADGGNGTRALPYNAWTDYPWTGYNLRGGAEVYFYGNLGNLDISGLTDDPNEIMVRPWDKGPHMPPSLFFLSVPPSWADVTVTR